MHIYLEGKFYMVLEIIKIILPIVIICLFIYFYVRKNKININVLNEINLEVFIHIILSPVIGTIISFIILIFDYTPLQASFIIIFGIFLPAIVNSLMAEKYVYDINVVSYLVVFGNIFSLISISIILYFLFF